MKNIKEFIFTHFYIIIPLISFLIWPFLLLYYYDFSPIPVDYHTFYIAGKYIFTNPEIIYTGDLPTQMGFYYLPSFACVFSILSLFEYKISIWIFFFILIIIFWLSIIELNKILILKDVNDKFSRFIILMVFSHGLRMWQMFNHLQVKWIVMFFILIFLRREIEKRKSGEEGFNFKFFFIQLNILFFAISMSPPLIFIILIYVFNNIRLKTIFSKLQLKKYLLCIIVFLGQNFMFIIFPNMFFYYLFRGLGHGFGKFDSPYVSAEDVINERITFPKSTLRLIWLYLNYEPQFDYISFISVCFLTTLLCLNKNLLIEDKYGYFMLLSLFLNIFFIKTRNLSIVIPCVMLLMINNIQGFNSSKVQKNLVAYIKNNHLFLIGMLSMSLLNFNPEMHLLLRLIPFLKVIPVPILILNWTLYYTIALISVILIRKNSVAKINGGDEKNLESSLNSNFFNPSTYKSSFAFNNLRIK